MNPLQPLPDRLVYAFDGEGRGAVVEPARTDVQPGEAFLWRHIRRLGKDPETQRRELADLDPTIREALTAEDTRPRCTVHENGVLLFLRGVNLNPGAEPDDMISLRLWIEERRVVSVWLRPLRAVEDVFDAVERGQAPVSPGDLVARLAQRLIDRMEPTVANLNEAVDELEDKVVEPNAVLNRGDLAQVRRQAIVLRRFVAPQRDALSTLSIEDLGWLGDRDRNRLREAADRTTRLAEELEAVRERAAVIQDQLMDRRSEEMNRRMLLLSVVASVFLPLSLLTGLLGINVAGMPGASSEIAFWIVCGLLVVLAVALVWLFKRLRLV